MFLKLQCSKATNRFPRKIQARFDLVEMHGGFDWVSPNEQHQGKHMGHVVSLEPPERLHLETRPVVVSHARLVCKCATRL